MHEDVVIKSFDKYLCSDACEAVVQKSFVNKCASCDKTCLKSDLYFINGQYVCSDECRKQMELIEQNSKDADENDKVNLNVEEEIKKSGEVLAKSQELNSELSRLKRMQEEIDHLKKKHSDIKVDMTIDLTRFEND